MAEHAVPLTSLPLNQQVEYVEAMRLGIQFSAHRIGSVRSAFHYAFPGELRCVTVVVNGGGKPVRWVYHSFNRNPDWVKQASAALAAHLKENPL